MSSPTGQLKIELIHHKSSSAEAVNGIVVVSDAAGLLWSFTATCFAHDLKPYANSQSLDFHLWKSAVNDALGYFYAPKATAFDYDAAYRAGLAPEAFAKHLVATLRQANSTEHQS